MAKSAQAFRTIREVADWLGVAAHVLRFWESKFNQIKPVKRAGGRRYYRPADMELVGGIKVLLHDRGMTIRGVQKMIADEGLEAVTALSPPIDGLLDPSNVVELDPTDAWEADAEIEASEGQPEPRPQAEIDAEAALLPEPSSQPSPAPPAAEPEVRPEAREPAGQLPEPEEAGPEAPLPDDTAPVSNPDPTPAPSSADSADRTAEPPVLPSSPPETAEAAPQPAEPSRVDPAPAPPTVPLPSAPPEAAKPLAAALPKADPAEGRLGQLARLGALSPAKRAALRPQIAALAALRDRVATDNRSI